MWPNLPQVGQIGPLSASFTYFLKGQQDYPNFFAWLPGAMLGSDSNIFLFDLFNYTNWKMRMIPPHAMIRKRHILQLWKIYSTGIKELVIRREAISLQLQGYEIWNFSVVCTYSTPTPHKGLELFRAIFVFGCQKKFFSKNCYCRLKNLFQKLSFMLDIGNAKSYKFHFLKNIFRQFLRERH